MKNLIITMTVILCIISSCAKKTDNEDAYIPPIKEDELIQGSPDILQDKNESSTTEDIYNESEQNIDNPVQSDSGSNDDKINTQTTVVKNKFANVFKEENTHQMPVGLFGCAEICSGYGSITIDDISYERRFYEPQQFPANSAKYNNLDFASMPLSGTKALLEYYVPNGIDGFVKSIEQKDTAELYTLPDDLATDPYINVIAVKLPTGENRLFYSYKTSDSLGEFLNMLTVHFGQECNDAKSVKEIYVNFSSEKLTVTDLQTTVTDPQSISALFEIMKKFPRAGMSNEAIDSDFIASGSVTFKNNMHLSFYSVGQGKINLNGFVSTADFAQKLCDIICSAKQ